MPMIKSGENAYRILLSLNTGEKRFSALVQEVRRASLAKELVALEKMKFIKRTVRDSRPPTTEYSITKLGREFLKSKAAERFVKVQTEYMLLKDLLPEGVRKVVGDR